MPQESVDASAERPTGLSRWAFIQFGPDYSAEHPIWMLDGLANLESMRLPSSLEARLQRWSSYLDTNYDFEAGWPAELPETWWRDEQTELPHDLAATIGSDAGINSIDGRYFRSRDAGTSPEAAAAMKDLITAGDAHDRRFGNATEHRSTFAMHIRPD